MKCWELTRLHRKSGLVAGWTPKVCSFQPSLDGGKRVCSKARPTHYLESRFGGLMPLQTMGFGSDEVVPSGLT
jgi:hypothetical protein